MQTTETLVIKALRNRIAKLNQEIKQLETKLATLEINYQSTSDKLNIALLKQEADQELINFLRAESKTEIPVSDLATVESPKPKKTKPVKKNSSPEE